MLRLFFVVILFTSSSLSAKQVDTIDKLKIVSECVFVTERVGFNLLFDIKYKNEEKTRKQLYWGYCTLKEKVCKGSMIDLTNKVINFMNQTNFIEWKIVDQTKTTLYLKWGELRSLRFDREKNTVEYIESGKSFFKGEDVEGRATVKCE